MAHTAYTAGLTEDWDLELDDNGDVQMLREAEAITQNVCNEGRLFTEDAYFRYDEGIPWFTDQLGQPLKEAVTASHLREAALNVPGVVSVNAVEIRSIDPETRNLRATMEITCEGGTHVRAEL